MCRSRSGTAEAGGLVLILASNYFYFYKESSFCTLKEKRNSGLVSLPFILEDFESGSPQ